MILAFTGTRRGATPAQLAAFSEAFPRWNPSVFVHGGARGADEQADGVAVRFLPAMSIVVYPSDATREAFWLAKMRMVYPPAPPLKRNLVIVRRADALVALPAELVEPSRRRAGSTWMTVRAARRMGKPITIIAPDGTVREELP
jgi:hypothetical protein